MKFIPHDYQKHAIEFIEAHPKAGLLLDMGLGKTAITLTAIDNLIYDSFEIKKVLVIAPLATAQNTWGTETEKWDHLDHLKLSLVLGTTKEREEALKTKADIYVINRENVVWLCEYYDGDFPFDMVVIDELSSFKSPQAKRFKALKKVIPLASRVVGLTGTPAPNGYEDLWSEIYLLDRGERLGKTLTQYRDAYFRPGRRNGMVVYEWVLQPFAKEIIDKKLSEICISMKAEDWLNMPDRIDTNIYVSMDEKERKLYEKFGREHIIQLNGEALVGINAASVQNKLLQMANGFAYGDDGRPVEIHRKKLIALRELIEASGQNPVLVFYSFIADRDRILQEFPEAVLLDPKRDVDRWNRGEIKILLAHPASAGHGLNLQQGGNIIVWYGLPWSLELYEQANARLHRQGQKNSVFIYYILAKDTHDEDVIAALQRKTLTQESLLAALKARLGGWNEGHKSSKK